MSEITTVGLDLAKRVVSLCGEDAAAGWSCSARLRREAVLAWFAQRPPCVVGMEACASAHWFARELAALGHTRAHHRAGVRATVPVVGEERCPRRGGDLCGGAPAAAALRDREDGPFKLHRTLTFFSGTDSSPVSSSVRQILEVLKRRRICGVDTVTLRHPDHAR